MSVTDVFKDLDNKLEVFNLLFVDILDKHATARRVNSRRSHPLGSLKQYARGQSSATHYILHYQLIYHIFLFSLSVEMCIHLATPQRRRSYESNQLQTHLHPPYSKQTLGKHVHLQLSSHLNSHNLLFPLQSGFHPSHSTQPLLLYCLDMWYKALDKKFVGVVFLDISNAFDTVDHNLLLSKLTNLDLSTSTVSWFLSYLSN